jgi:hypothetical protein
MSASVPIGSNWAMPAPAQATAIIASASAKV